MASPPRSRYEWFCTALGMSRIDRRSFHPLFHEVVVVDVDDDDTAPPVLVEELWRAS